jgi:hypothetical protein
MISSTSSSSGAARPDLNPTPGAAAARPPAPQSDQLSTERAAFLRAELVRQPEIRPDVVARARTLAADPNYPPAHVIARVASQILAAPDLSEAGD